MGGKALNKYGVHTDRKNTKEFNELGNIIRERIELYYPVNCSIVKCYHNKTDHGDLDLLIKFDNGININWKDAIEKHFAPKAINANGNVYSFDFKNFQIDIIPVNESKWEIANVYYSYDPLGNIMGKTFHKFGLSYGWEGLFYKFRNFNGRNSKNILISNNPEKIFEFGGFNYNRYLQGFDDLEDIFKFVIDSKYFDTEIFQMNNLKSIDKKRNRKRGSYHIFLKYLKDNMINITYPFDKNKDSYLPMINKYFPESKIFDEIKLLEKIDSRNKFISQKFNGDIVMSWIPDLKGKELGQAIGKFMNVLGDEYNDFIYNSSYEMIYNRFMEIYNEK